MSIAAAGAGEAISGGLAIAGAAGAFNASQPSYANLNMLQNQEADILGAEEGFNAQWDPTMAGQQNLATQAQLFGTNGSTITVPGGHKYSFGASPGTIGMMQAAQAPLTGIATAGQTQQRAADIGDVAALGPGLQQAERAYNPQATNLLGTLTSQAQQQLGANGGLTPAQLRQYQQQIRGSQAARGLGQGDGAAAQEAQYVFTNQQALRAQNQQLAQGVLGAQAAYYGGPTSVLGLPTAQVPGLNMSPYAGNLEGNQSNEEDNLFGTQYGGSLAVNAANHQQQMAAIGSLGGMGGSMGSGGGSGGSGGGGLSSLMGMFGGGGGSGATAGATSAGAGTWDAFF